jgi:uncharacterized protein YjiS (DUF1127 family)
MQGQTDGTSLVTHARTLRNTAIRDSVIAAWRLLATWRQRARQRRQLAELDERALRDLGLSHADAFREATKPFWRP